MNSVNNEDIRLKIINKYYDINVDTSKAFVENLDIIDNKIDEYFVKRKLSEEVFKVNHQGYLSNYINPLGPNSIAGITLKSFHISNFWNKIHDKEYIYKIGLKMISKERLDELNIIVKDSIKSIIEINKLKSILKNSPQNLFNIGTIYDTILILKAEIIFIERYLMNTNSKINEIEKLKEEVKQLKIENEKLKSDKITKEDIIKIFQDLQESKLLVSKNPFDSEDDPFDIYVNK
jgi:hypothetical protein